MYKNSYFQLSTKEDGTYITIYPPMLDGAALKYPELNSYLLVHKFSSGSFDAESLKKAVESSRTLIEVKLCDAAISPVDEELLLKASDDKMQLIGRFYCASDGGKQMTRESILNKLRDSGVEHGIIDKNITDYLLNRQYCTDILLASGTLPKESRDSVIKYMFRRDKNFQPTVLQDGSVDFRKLNLIAHVKSGDVLAVKIPAHTGAAGMDIYGNIRPSRKPIDQKLFYGSGVELSPDECQLVAQISGHVVVVDKKITVTSVYKIDGNVGTSTGNITFDGSVEVKGDILTDYIVEATGNILIGGCVEGSTLIAGGEIILTRGIHGMNKAKLIAEGNITAKFIESCTVTSGGNVTAEAILYSKVSADGQIIVMQGKGLISGGELKAGVLIKANVVGSERMGANTLLEVGVAPQIIERARELEKEILAKQTERKKIQQVIALIKKKVSSGEAVAPDKAQLLQTLPLQLSAKTSEISAMLNEYSELKTKLDRSNDGKIVIDMAIHSGTKLRIANVSYYVRETIHSCEIVKDGAEIRFKK